MERKLSHQVTRCLGAHETEKCATLSVPLAPMKWRKSHTKIRCQRKRLKTRNSTNKATQQIIN